MKFSTSAPCDCAGIAPQLTALFDGEADDVAARAARAHLLSCPTCSRLWLDWTRHRDTLQSEPAPTVPPTLLWRVLIAYRVTAFARPARRRSRLPEISAIPLRGIEAPLPPRLTSHILALTTRKSHAHVMLTPMSAAPSTAKSRWSRKERAFSFGSAPLWAAPALALWVLMLGRTDFNATLPTTTPDAAINLATPEVRVSEKLNSTDKSDASALIPVAASPFVVTPLATMSIIASVAAPIAPSARLANQNASNIATPRVVLLTAPVSAPAPRAEPIRSDARAEQGLSRAVLMAINTGQHDITSNRVLPVVASNRTRATQVSPPAPAVETPMAQSQTPVARAVNAAPRPSRIARRVPEDMASARVTLAAMVSPVSPIRVFGSARLRTAAFSDDSLRPRVAHLSADGRRLARLAPAEGAIPLRVSRPSAGAPTIREVSFSNADNGPKLDELRSAVDDFRASVAGDE